MQHHKYSLTELENMVPWGEGGICYSTDTVYKRRKREKTKRGWEVMDEIKEAKVVRT